MSFLGENAAQRRYNGRTILASLIYAGLLLAEQYAVHRTELPKSSSFVLALLPAIPVIAIFVFVGRYLVEEQDEYLRMRMVRQLLWTTGLTLAATTLWGFLEDAGLPHLPVFYVAVVWFTVLGPVGSVLALRDR